MTVYFGGIGVLFIHVNHGDGMVFYPPFNECVADAFSEVVGADEEHLNLFFCYANEGYWSVAIHYNCERGYACYALFGKWTKPCDVGRGKKRV